MFFFMERQQKGSESISFDHLITHSCPLKHFIIHFSFQYFTLFINSPTCTCLETINIFFTFILCEKCSSHPLSSLPEFHCVKTE